MIVSVSHSDSCSDLTMCIVDVDGHLMSHKNEKSGRSNKRCSTDFGIMRFLHHKQDAAAIEHSRKERGVGRVHSMPLNKASLMVRRLSNDGMSSKSQSLSTIGIRSTHDGAIKMRRSTWNEKKKSVANRVLLQLVAEHREKRDALQQQIEHTTQHVACLLQAGNEASAIENMRYIFKQQAEKDRVLQVIVELNEVLFSMATSAPREAPDEFETKIDAILSTPVAPTPNADTGRILEEAQICLALASHS